eukprot:4086219-Pleurochrysis_carterae.AAC.2
MLALGTAVHFQPAMLRSHARVAQNIRTRACALSLVSRAESEDREHTTASSAAWPGCRSFIRVKVEHAPRVSLQRA